MDLGRIVLINQLTFPQQSKVLTRKKREQPLWKRKPPSESKDAPFISIWASPEPPATVRLWSNRCERHSFCTFLPNSSVKYDIEKFTRSQCGKSETHQLLWLRELPWLPWPFGDAGATAANKLWHKAASTVIHSKPPSWGSLVLPVCCLCSNSKMRKHTHDSRWRAQSFLQHSR